MCAVDASGTFSETKRQAGLLRMVQAGVMVSDYCTLMVEILKDNLATGGRRGLWGHGHGLGQARRSDLRGIREEIARLVQNYRRRRRIPTIRGGCLIDSDPAVHVKFFRFG